MTSKVSLISPSRIRANLSLSSRRTRSFNQIPRLLLRTPVLHTLGHSPPFQLRDDIPSPPQASLGRGPLRHRPCSTTKGTARIVLPLRSQRRSPAFHGFAEPSPATPGSAYRKGSGPPRISGNSSNVPPSMVLRGQLSVQSCLDTSPLLRKIRIHQAQTIVRSLLHRRLRSRN